VLAETLSLVDVPRPTVLIFSVLADKDWRGMLAELAGVVDHAVLTIAPTSPPNRVWSPAEALDVARAMGLSAEVELDFDRTLARASEWASVLVTGSFHTVGDAMERLQVDPLAE
jgi:dihydrofolate synthase/folylpolyglutamate synthase